MRNQYIMQLVISCKRGNYAYIMSRVDDVVAKLKKRTGNFTYDEAVWLVKQFGYEVDQCGRTSGSRIAFLNHETGRIIRLHRPHPGNTLKRYQQDEIIMQLKENGNIK